MPLSLLLGDETLTDHLLQRVLQKAHALVALGLENRLDLEDFLLADEVRDGARDDHDLQGRQPPSGVGTSHQPLRDHRAQRLGEHQTDLLLLVGREGSDQPVDRPYGAALVKSAQHQVSCLGGGECQRGRG